MTTLSALPDPIGTPADTPPEIATADPNDIAIERRLTRFLPNHYELIQKLPKQRDEVIEGIEGVIGFAISYTVNKPIEITIDKAGNLSKITEEVRIFMEKIGLGTDDYELKKVKVPSFPEHLLSEQKRVMTDNQPPSTVQDTTPQTY